MSGNPKAVPFHGILAVGNTKDEAINRYRLLAQGKGVSAMVDEGQSLCFVTHASSNLVTEMFNPSTGDLNLKADDAILSRMEFDATASGEIEANHYVCASGCGLHMVYDSEALVQHCPACTTAIASDDDGEDESEDEESEDDEETDEDADDESLDDEDEEDEESESADDEDEEDEGDDEEDESDEEDEEDDSEEDDSDDEDDSEEDDEEDEGDDEEDEEDDSGEPLVIAADSKEKAIEIYQANRVGIATAATSVEVEYMVCSSAECNAHVISEDSALSDCPACTSPLKQPEVVAETAPAAPQAAQAGDDEEDEEDENDLNVVDEEDDEEDEDTSESNDQTKADNMNVETVTVDMLSQVKLEGEKPYEGLDLSYSGSIAGNSMWTAYLNGTPVATASKVDAGKNADIFENPAFGNAVIASAKHIGVKEALTELGFKGIAHEISISSVIAQRVEKQVAEANDALSRDRKEHAERLMAALATAAIGINRGFFTGVANPVKAALWNAVSSAGVKNAEVLIDNAFKASSDAYHTILFAQAGEIMSKPLEVQESLSKAVLGTNYMQVSESSSAPSNGLENRLENFGTAVASEMKPDTRVAEAEQESVSSDDARITNVVANLGRRRG